MTTTSDTSDTHPTTSSLRTRWAAIGAAVAITLGAGGIGITNAATSEGEKAIYQPIEPCRLADLRPGDDQVGPRSAPLGPNETYTLSGWGTVGECTLPTGVTALSLNVTALDATDATFLTLFPGSGTPPLASSLNPAPGQPPTPNAVNVDLDDAGQFSVFNKAGNVNVIVDVVGLYNDHIHADDPNRPDVIANVNSNGTFWSGGDGIESVTYLNGTYTIAFTDFDYSINDGMAIATITGSNASVRTISTSSTGGNLLVYVRAGNGSGVPSSFSLAVWHDIDDD